MSRAATKTGTRHSRAMERDHLHRAARRQFPDAPRHVVDQAVNAMQKMARQGRLRLDPRHAAP